MIYGALVEAMITFISRYVALHSETWDTHVANYTNSIGKIIYIFLLFICKSLLTFVLTSVLTFFFFKLVTAILCVVGKYIIFHHLST